MNAALLRESEETFCDRACRAIQAKKHADERAPGPPSTIPTIIADGYTP